MIEVKKDYSISFCRLIATLFIVICHIMQYFEVELAWWFNVGVQMFLFISGFLYAKRKIYDPVGFYKKTFSKILLEYYVYIIIFLIGYLIVKHDFLNFDAFIGLITFSSTVHGIGHLWFIPYILACYFLTPILIKFFDKIQKKNNIKHFISAVFILLMTHLMIYFFVDYFIPAYIVCFVMGILFGRIEKRPRELTFLKVIVAIFAIVMNIVQIWIVYFKGEALPVAYTSYAHVFFGIFLTVVLRSVFLYGKKIFKRKKKAAFLVKSVLDWSDKYSYDIYIVHHIYILSDISIYLVMGSGIRSSIVIVILTIISAILLKTFANLIRKIFKKIVRVQSIMIDERGNKCPN